MSNLKSSKSSFTDEDFLNLIKDDPTAIRQYIKGLSKLYKSELKRKELIKQHIDKQLKKSMELLHISYFSIFIRGVSNPERYLNNNFSKDKKNK